MTKEEALEKFKQGPIYAEGLSQYSGLATEQAFLEGFNAGKKEEIGWTTFEERLPEIGMEIEIEQIVSKVKMPHFLGRVESIGEQEWHSHGAGWTVELSVSHYPGKSLTCHDGHRWRIRK